MDRAVSDHPAVQRQLDRLATLSPGADILGLERIYGPARSPRQSRAPSAARPPRRRDQRQGLDLRLPPGGGRGGRAERPCLHQPPSGPLQRAHPPRRTADRRRGPGRPARRGARRGRDDGDQLLRGDHRRRLPRLRAHARRRLHRRGGARRPARRDQRRPRPGGLRNRPARPRPPAIPRRPDRGYRGGESGDRQGRRAAGHPALSRPAGRADRRGGGGGGRDLAAARRALGCRRLRREAPLSRRGRIARAAAAAPQRGPPGDERGAGGGDASPPAGGGGAGSGAQGGDGLGGLAGAASAARPRSAGRPASGRLGAVARRRPQPGGGASDRRFLPRPCARRPALPHRPRPARQQGCGRACSSRSATGPPPSTRCRCPAIPTIRRPSSPPRPEAPASPR